MKYLYIIPAALFMFLVFRFMSMFYKSKNGAKLRKKNINLFNSIYGSLIKIPFMSKEINSIKKRLYDNYLYEDRVLKYKAAFYFVLSWFIGILLFIGVSVLYRDNIFQVVILSVFCYYLRGVILESLIGTNTELLEGLYEFNEDLNADYPLRNSIDEAIEDAKLESGNYLLVRHIEHMKDVKKALEHEENLESYMNDCSNEYLRLLALNCYMTKEYGDPKLEKEESSFLENLKHFNKLIFMEITKRKKINYYLKPVQILCIAPLLFFQPYQWFVDTFLTMLNTFYKSSWGFILKIVITAVLVSFFFITRKFIDVEANPLQEKKHYWEEFLLKFKPLSNFVNFLIPKEGTKRFYRLRNLISKSHVNTNMRWIQVQKIAVFIVSFIFFIAMAVSIHSINRISVINDDTSQYGISISYGEQIDTDTVENNFIKTVGENNLINLSKNEIKQRLKISGHYDEAVLDTLADDVYSKLIKFNNEYVRWYEVIVCLVLSFFTAQIPIMYLKIKVKSTEFNMHSEVMLYESIVLILMNYDNTSIELILEYMSKFGRIFKEQIDQAIFNIQKGTKEALSEVISNDRANEIIATQLQSSDAFNENTAEQEVLNNLINRVDFKPFKNLIKNLIKADDIPVSQAFATLSSYRSDKAKTREEENNKTVENRISIGSKLSKAALYIFIIIYTIGPMGYVAYTQGISMQKAISQMSSY